MKNSITIELNFQDGKIVGEYKIIDSDENKPAIETTIGIAEDGNLAWILDNALYIPSDCKLIMDDENNYHGKCNNGKDCLVITYDGVSEAMFKHDVSVDNCVITVYGHGFTPSDFSNLKEFLNQLT